MFQTILRSSFNGTIISFHILFDYAINGNFNNSQLGRSVLFMRSAVIRGRPRSRPCQTVEYWARERKRPNWLAWRALGGSPWCIMRSLHAGWPQTTLLRWNMGKYESLEMISSRVGEVTCIEIISRCYKQRGVDLVYYDRAESSMIAQPAAFSSLASMKFAFLANLHYRQPVWQLK